MISRPRFLLSLALTTVFAASSWAADSIKIVLVAGKVKEVDKMGHHDYLGGCRLMQVLLKQNPGVDVVLVNEEWPADEKVFEGAATVVFYTDGGGKQAYLATPEHVATVQKMADGKTGLVNLHQAVEFTPAFAQQSINWTGAVYNGLSSRGHWDSTHDVFPKHEITSGVTPWKINDGWLNHLQFTEGMKGITPLVWSGKEKLGSPEGGDKDIVGWTYDRPSGGRSFSFSGLDAHGAWEQAGMRQLVINGVLWSAGVAIPAGGAKCEADKASIDSFMTPRIAPPKKVKPEAAPGAAAEKPEVK
ncbi:ThuA domain-containing protein [Prosthecobacter sp.]|uniref:ThuA domain-containing protein n=1 Tax=Prosthecobacter sp. TaxID=1965333 RepID=UPI003783D782